MKTLINIVFILFFFGAFAQMGNPQESHYISSGEKNDHKQKRQSRAAFWMEDFANGLAGNNGDGGWTRSGADSLVWKHSFYGTSGEFSAATPQPNTSSAGNGFMLLDCDSLNFPNSPNYQDISAALISPRIDLSSQNTVILSFEHWFQYFGYPDFELMLGLSNDDGLTWTEMSVDNNLPQSTSPPNPSFFQVNVSSLIANEDSVRIRFRWDNATHYFWVIDDIRLEEAPPYDLELRNFVWETNYSGIPGYSNQGLHYTSVKAEDDYTFLFSGDVHNLGSQSVNAWLKLEVESSSGIIASLNSDSSLLTSNQTFRDTIAFQIPNIPYEDFKFRMYAEMDSIALDSSYDYIDSVTIKASGTEGLFAKDNFQPSNLGFWNGINGAGNTNYFELVTAFRFKKTTDICGLDVFFHPASSNGALAFPVVYQVDSVGNFGLIFHGHDYVINSTYQHTMQVSFGSSLQCDSGTTYLFGVGHYGGPDSLVVLMSDHGTHLDQSTFYYSSMTTGGPWYETDGTPFIRPHNDLWICIGSTKDHEDISFELYPNPSSGLIHVSWPVNFEAQTCQIRSIDGKLVHSCNLSESQVHEAVINCKILAEGIYTMTLTGPKQSGSQKFVLVR